MELAIDHTTRGFELVAFEDRNGESCSLQQSSIADFEPPGSSAIWFGRTGVRMHLSKKDVQQLLPLLQNWVETGSFDRVSESDERQSDPASPAATSPEE